MLGGHRTSISLEAPFFAELERLAASEGTSFNGLVARIDREREPGNNLSSALRLHVVAALKAEAGR